MTHFTNAQERAIARLIRGMPDRMVVCIGASALAHHIPLSRMTNDIDLTFVAAPLEVATRSDHDPAEIFVGPFTREAIGSAAVEGLEEEGGRGGHDLPRFSAARLGSV